MDKISAMMDDELPPEESDLQIQRLRDEPDLTESWATYHLIRDCLRNDGKLTTDFRRRFRERLEQEPTVLAPRPRQRGSGHLSRYVLPAAAAVAGVSVVAWLGLSSPALKPAVAPGTVAQSSAPPASQGAEVQTQVVLQGNVSDYLSAHQEFSPRTAMQGVASYVRTVATEQQIQDR